MGTETRFLTYQTVARYEAALARHAQYCRWVKVYTCPCVNENTNQPDVNCSICKGRGEIYKKPGPFKIIDEAVVHDNKGRVYLTHENYIEGSVVLWRTITGGSHEIVELDPTQPSDKSYIQLASPWLKNYERLYANYEFTNNINITNGTGSLVRSDILTIVPDDVIVNFKGKTYYGDITEITRVYNKTKDETYTVSSYSKQYIFIETPSITPEITDEFEIDFSYQSPYSFVLHSVSAKLRFEAAYVIDQADAILQTPYYYNVKPADLITALSMEVPGTIIINPNVTGDEENDFINNVFDVCRITGIINAYGQEYDISSDVMLIGRNEIKWITTKPTANYTVQFMYNPTFVGLITYDTTRASENKSFVNRLNVMMRDRLTKEITF